MIPWSSPWSLSEISFDKNAFKVGLTISDKAAIGIIANTSISWRTRPNENNAIIPQAKEKDIKFLVDSLSKNFNRIMNAWTMNNKTP